MKRRQWVAPIIGILVLFSGCAATEGLRVAAESNIGPFHSKVYAHAHEARPFAFAFDLSGSPLTSELTFGIGDVVGVTAGSEVGWAGKHAEFAGLGIAIEPIPLAKPAPAPE